MTTTTKTVWVVERGGWPVAVAPTREAAEALCAARGWGVVELTELPFASWAAVTEAASEAASEALEATAARAALEATAAREAAARAFAAWKARRCIAARAAELRCRSSRRITSRRCA